MSRVGVTAACIVIGLADTLAGCTTRPSSSERSAPAPAATSTTPRECTGNAGEAPLRGFFRDLSNHRDPNDLLAEYVDPPQDFVRWWDGTLAPGEVLTFYNDLPGHLRDLQQDGIDLTVTAFKDVGFQGRGDVDAGGWFNFSLSGRMHAGERVAASKTLSHKGAVDCATGKLKVIVI